MEINGIITKINAEEKKTETFSVLTIMADCSTYSQMGDKYENHLCFQFTGNKIEKFKAANVKEGDRVVIKFMPQGRYYDKKDSNEKGHSQNLNAYGIEPMVKTSNSYSSNAVNNV